MRGGTHITDAEYDNGEQRLFTEPAFPHTMPVDDLVRECAASTRPDIWAEFLSRFQKLITFMVRRTCRSLGLKAVDAVEDLVQETYLKLCANDRSLLMHFRPQHAGAFLGYIRAIVTSVVYDYFRSQHAIKRNTDNEVELKTDFGFAVAGYGEAKWAENEILLGQIDSLLCERGMGSAEEKERMIFWLYYRYGLTSAEIASISSLGLTVKGVESVFFRLRKFLRTRAQNFGAKGN